MPVLDEKAEERYQRQQRKTKPSVEEEGTRDATGTERDLRCEEDVDVELEGALGVRDESDPPSDWLPPPPPFATKVDRADRIRVDRKADSVPSSPLLKTAGDRGRYPPPLAAE